MKYKNANDILPSDLLQEIQKYTQGVFIYIPKKDRQKNVVTEYKVELQKRNDRIYKMHLEGISNKQLSKNYSLSQSSIRRIIIEQRNKFIIMSERIKLLLSNWDLENQNMRQIYHTTWQIGDNYVLKLYNDSDSLKRNILINEHLKEMGIPVGKTISTINGEKYIEDNGQFFFLSEKLKGSNIVSLKFGNDIARTMGKIIANLHVSFKSLDNEIEIWDNSLLSEMNGWVRDSLEECSWQTISKEDYDTSVENLEKFYDELPVQLIHRDVHFGNFLFDNNNFSGYIDFDLSQKNIRIFDLCYFVLSVLSEKDKFELAQDRWFEFTKNVFSGYNEILALTSDEKKSAVFVMECIEILFIAYYESQNDTISAKNTFDIFSFIHQNERRISKLF